MIETSNTEIKVLRSEQYVIVGDWDKQANVLKARYPQLTSEDLKFETGKETDLFQRLVNKLNKNLNEIIYILKANQKTCCQDNNN
ncbi:hypothetical protein CJ739_2439 [Mariniflexile rhizosphaerae]|uniref:hypothetical protein n=1 Tax=unclassified Mariniflexile TaxID=2643887 RepID=UPI000CB7122B|nr:hypothetical protein [Mariniflexile sp. TRM1-10]AXP81512.1 hypothetical protein CJ739_2439 [Mariniflexile sp. TRM1-10]PLB18431.1 MAG: hypothetical protein TRG1_2711 [Flavobacteriaceae bacterium FS1-H7996/R]